MQPGEFNNVLGAATGLPELKPISFHPSGDREGTDNQLFE